MMDYVGQAVPTNSVEVDAWTGNYQEEQDQFAENEKLLIVLTGKIYRLRCGAVCGCNP